MTEWESGVKLRFLGAHEQIVHRLAALARDIHRYQARDLTANASHAATL